MPRTAEDVENYLLQLDRRWENDGGTYLLSPGKDAPPIALRVAPPIVALRVTIGTIPQDIEHQTRLFRKLLEYNATDLMHISYGIDDGNVILSAALPLENLDINELEATLSDVDLALMRHIHDLYEAAKA